MATRKAQNPQQTRPRGRAGYVRAAFAYSGLKQQQLVDALGVSESTLTRWGNSDPPTAEQLERIAAVCEVPLDFLENGFAISPLDDENARRLRQLERRLMAVERSGALPDRSVTALDERVGALETQLRERADRVDQRFERLEEDLEARLATLVTQALEQAEQPAPSTRRRRGA